MRRIYAQYAGMLYLVKLITYLSSAPLTKINQKHNGRSDESDRPL
jgi:hypothetical protein